MGHGRRKAAGRPGERLLGPTRGRAASLPGEIMSPPRILHFILIQG